MNYQRVLMLTELGVDARATFAAIRRFAPRAAQLVVIAQRRANHSPWSSLTLDMEDTAAPEPETLREAAELSALREAAALLAPTIDVAVASDLTVDPLADAVAASTIDLVVAGPAPPQLLSLLAELRKRVAVAVLCIRSPLEASTAQAQRCLLCVGLSARGRGAIGAFLRDHAGPGDRVVLLSSRGPPAEDLNQLREVCGIAAEVEVVAAPADPLGLLLSAPPRQKVDLVVLPRFPPAALLSVTSGPPIVILPPVQASTPEWERGIDLPDLVDDGALIRVRIDYAVGVGNRTPIADQELAFVREGSVVAKATSLRGETELPSGIAGPLGVFRTHGKESADPVASIEQRVRILRAGCRPVVLFDADLEEHELAPISGVAWADPVAVRMRPLRSYASLRAKLRGAGLPPCVIDAGAVLGEGHAPDVPALVDAIRLARLATRLRADGYPVSAIVYRGPHEPAARGFVAIRPPELAALRAPSTAPPTRASLAERLNATTGSESIGGNRITIELDNPTARDWLLSAIHGSRRRVHLQVYMAADDDVGRAVEAALAAAGARGVAVRVLVDSLHGLHGSFGARNPLLERLSARPGVELHVWKPITGPPSLEDLKQRDHRKLVVVDGALALLGGRNLSHEYYAGFQEIPLSPDMAWRMVPWLEAGARVEGPAVAALEHSFLDAWTGAGGEPFDLPDPAPAGPTTARVVVHRGLRDAATLEAYLALIENAQSHVYAVNTFPLLLEVQHALLRALRRGVRVRALFGNLTPRQGDTAFRGPWAGVRTTATSFVHSRMDALVGAGAECYEFIVRRQACWDPATGDVRPHVHAKMMSADGRICAVGSANFDIAAAYWESELLLVVEDEAITRAVEARLDELIAGSARVDPNDPAWRRRAQQRQWMMYWPGMLSG